jgi:hypothetical protein
MIQQPNLFTAEPVRPKKAGHVRSTSVAVAHELRAHLSEREGAVLEWLVSMSRFHLDPTSAELARWRWRDQGLSGKTSTDCLLYVRRGLSDLQTHGLVESSGKRTCQVSGRLSIVWRVKSR